jgi:hypothetical protein
MQGTLGTLWCRWLVLCGKAGDLVMLCVLTLFYFVLFLIPSLYYTFLSDTVGRGWHDGSYFGELPGGDETPEEAGEMA